MNRRISDELCASYSGIVVQYLDDEDDWITVWNTPQLPSVIVHVIIVQVTNDSEWQEAIRVGSYQSYCNDQTVNFKVTIIKVPG